jgi:RNA-directed DNA polymerase
VRRIYIPKANSDELRPLGIPTIYDRAVQALYIMALLPVSEARADLRSFGFSGKNNLKNLVLLHKECHKQLTFSSNKLLKTA